MRREHRSYEWARAGDRSEMVTEHHPLVGDQKIASVFEALGRRGAERIEHQNLDGNKAAVEAVSKRIAASGSNH